MTDILRDGQRLRVPMMMRDHLTPLQRAVADATFDASLHRPGFRYAADYTPQREALDQYIRDITTAWQPRDGEGSAVNGTQPPPTDADPRDAAYRDYCDRLTNAWRTP